MKLAACRMCGVATDLSNVAGNSARYGFCDDCATLDPARPGVLLRAAARVLGAPEGDRFLADELADEDGVLEGLAYVNPRAFYGPRGPRPQGTPWQHVSDGDRAELRRARARSLAARLRAAGELGQHPPRIR
jgi:hypothetical protein